MHNIRTAVAALAAAGFATVAAVTHAQAPGKAAGQGAPPAAAAHVMMNAADLKWGAAPDAFNPGAQFAVVDGDPSKAAPFVVRLKFPDGYKVMPHWHPTDEIVTVLSGTLVAGMGEKWDDAAMKAFTAGGFARLPKKRAHYVTAKGDTIVQVQAMGPFVLTYVNAKDDPRSKKKTQ